MKQLILVRHAKSCWETPVHDKDRPLTNKGIRDAHIVSDFVLDKFPRTFLVWSSTARRAKETAIIFSQNISFPTESIIFMDELYSFECKKLEKSIKNCLDEYTNLIVFGHNSAITDFVNKYGDTFIDNVPTSGVVSLTFDSNKWSEINKGKTQDVVFPSELKKV